MAKYGDYRDFLPGGELYNQQEFNANEAQRGNATGTYATHGGSKDEVQSALDEMSKDPRIMSLLQNGKTEAVESELAKRGLAIPQHHALDIDNGRIVSREQGKWERWKTPILLSAAMFGGGFALEALAGAGGTGLTAAPMLGGYSSADVAAGIGTGAVAGGGAAAGALPATVMSGMAPGVTSLPAGTSSVLGGGGGGGSSLFSRALNYGKGTDKLGQTLGSLGKTMANNRDAKLAASLDRDRLMVERQAEDRAERNDAWKKLNYADYSKNAGPIAPYVRGQARTMPGYTPGPEVAQGAQGLENEVMKRLIGGSQLPPVTDVEKAAKMGTGEKLANIGGIAASFFGR